MDAVFFKVLSDAVNAVVADIETKSHSASFEAGLRHYLSILEPSLKRYQHHLGGIPGAADLLRRYQYETALLHVLTQLLAQAAKHKDSSILSIWPVSRSQSPYSWYTPPSALLEITHRLSEQLSQAAMPGLVASELCSRLFTEGTKTYLGEFYTPVPIAEHLVALAGLKPEHLLESQQAVADPACGNGIILSVIAEQVLAYGKSHGYSAEKVIYSLASNLYGLDVQPFAIVATKTLLSYSCLHSYGSSAGFTLKNPFPNVQLTDPLSSLELWSKPRFFKYIVGNPPFMAVKRALLDFVDQYIEVIDGHPNLFQLFLWWAVNAVAPGGIISFLLPQSLLAAYYFRRLRKKLTVSTKLLRVTRILDHKGLFGDADQQMMAACFQVVQEKARPGTVEIRVTQNGSGLATRKPYNARYSRVVQDAKEQDAIWIVSDNVLDYTICERLEDNCIPLSELALTYELGNGGYVWNQNKELVQQEEAEGSWPLLSAASIRPYGVDFPYLGSHASRTRQFSLLNDKVRGLAYSGPALLIQRTTPRKVGRRLVAGVPPETFFARYPHYFLENHVNHIRVREGVEAELLYGLMVWLNSDLMNFSFHLRNGTAQVSLYELGMLPVNLTVVRQVADQGLKIAHSDPKMRESLAQAVDDDLYDWLGLGVRHRRRVARVLKLRAGNSAS